MKERILMNTDFSRSKALNNIPNKKVYGKLLEAVQSCEVCSKKEVINPEGFDGVCPKCAIIHVAYNRYAEANIPIEYWGLKMEKDFIGNKVLLDKYTDITSDLKGHYQKGTSICFAGLHGVGKQLCLETELPTPAGFIRLKDLKEGDLLFDEQGKTCKVIKLHPIQLSPESYEINFDDGSKIEACADHLWLTWTRNDRLKKEKAKPTIKTTKEILNTLKVNNNTITNHSILCSKPVQYLSQNLLIDPYVLGCWLGDGSSREGAIECADQEILDNIIKNGYSITLSEGSVGTSKSCRYRIGDLIYNDKIKNHCKLNPIFNKIGTLCYQLKQLNLLNNKHIPEMYLHSSYEQRLALLQGLMDTDGCCLKSGLAEYTTCLPKLADQTAEIIRSLGIKCNVNQNKSHLYGVRHKDRYRITFTTQLPVFKLNRKLNNIRLNKSQINRTQHRYITSIKSITSKPMRCITVDSLSHLFLATRSFIPTHNTMTATCILKKAAQKGFTCLYTNLSDIVNVLIQGSNEDRFLSRRELVMVDFLVIDEFDSRFMPSENSADLYARTLEGVFRTRSQNKLPTLMCTNSPNIEVSFTGAMQASIDSLMKGYMKKIDVFGEDIRKKKAE